MSAERNPPLNPLPATTVAWAECLSGLRLRITLASHRLEVAPGATTLPHVVQFPKLLLVQEGGLEYELNGSVIPLRAGSLLLRPALSLARWQAARRHGCRLAYCEFAGATTPLPPWHQPLLLASAASLDADGILQRLRDAQLQEDPLVHLEAEAELKTLLLRFLRHAAPPESAADAAAPGAVAQALRWLGDQMAEPQAALRGLPRRVGLSPGYFRLRFRQHTGLSARAFLTRLRLHHARELLRFAGVPVKQAALASGFRDPLHFSKLYHARFGVAPSTERRAAGREPFAAS